MEKFSLVGFFFDEIQSEAFPPSCFWPLSYKSVTLKSPLFFTEPGEAQRSFHAVLPFTRITKDGWQLSASFTEQWEPFQRALQSRFPQKKLLQQPNRMKRNTEVQTLGIKRRETSLRLSRSVKKLKESENVFPTLKKLEQGLDWLIISRAITSLMRQYDHIKIKCPTFRAGTHCSSYQKMEERWSKRESKYQLQKMQFF